MFTGIKTPLELPRCSLIEPRRSDQQAVEALTSLLQPRKEPLKGSLLKPWRSPVLYLRSKNHSLPFVLFLSPTTGVSLQFPTGKPFVCTGSKTFDLRQSHWNTLLWYEKVNIMMGCDCEHRNSGIFHNSQWYSESTGNRHDKPNCSEYMVGRIELSSSPYTFNACQYNWLVCYINVFVTLNWALNAFTLPMNGTLAVGEALDRG